MDIWSFFLEWDPQIFDVCRCNPKILNEVIMFCKAFRSKENIKKIRLFQIIESVPNAKDQVPENRLRAVL
jgi:hypothetical protein